MATQADVDIEPEEDLFASLARETAVCLVPSLKELSFGEYHLNLKEIFDMVDFQVHCSSYKLISHSNLSI